MARGKRASRGPTAESKLGSAVQTKRTSRAAGSAPPLAEWGDDALIALFVRANHTSHGRIRTVCKRFDAVLKLPEFREERRETGYDEGGIIVVGGTSRGVQRLSEGWLYTRGTWRPLPQMASPRSAAASVVFNNQLFLLGGRGPKLARLDTVEAYDPQLHSWRSCPSLISCREGGTAAVIDSAIVVAGGGAGQQWHQVHVAAEKFRPAAGPTKLPPLPHDANHATGCELDGWLYVAGGSRGNFLQVFDGSKWRQKAPLPERRVQAASVAFNGKLMLIGGSTQPNVSDDAGNESESDEGFGPTTSVILYNPCSNEWSSGPSLPAPRVRARAVKRHDGTVVVVGGGGPPLSYDGNAWSELPGIPGRGDLHSMSVGAVIL